MRSHLRALARGLALPLCAGLIIPAIQWCSLDWADVTPDCLIRCAVAPPPVCQSGGMCDAEFAVATAKPCKSDVGCEATPACAEASTRAKCTDATTCPLSASSDCEHSTAPDDAPPVKHGRAFCFDDTAGGPARTTAAPTLSSVPVLAALFAIITGVESPKPRPTRHTDSPRARPPTDAWRTSTPVRGPPFLRNDLIL